MRAGRSFGGAEPCAMCSTLATSAATSSSGRNSASSDLDQWPESRGNRVANLGRLVGFVALDYHFKNSDLTTDHEKRCPRHTAAKAHSADGYRGCAPAPDCSLLP